MNKEINKSEMKGILDPDGINPNPLTGNPYSENYKSLAKNIWSKFPAYQDRYNIIDKIKENQVVLVVSGTGSGKTVLFPKYVLHALNYDKKIAITLPKQLITQTAATFAAETLDVKLGEDVGYQYRGSGKNTYSSKTKLLYCTDGTLVARLNIDPELSDFSAVLIDEAHERKINIDLLLFMLRNVLHVRPDFKLVIMSATINETIFRDYYKEFKYVSLSISTQPNYPIKSIFLNEEIDASKYINVGMKIIKDIITARRKDQGGILFFVTSINETESICNLLQSEGIVGEFSNVCVPVFSGMNKDKQKIATDKEYYRQFTTADDGIKIIIATNVAESSLTIDGVTDVIDSGLELKSRFDPIDRIDILDMGIITHAQAKQRMGRTGRTSPGTCYHLYTRDTFENKMIKFPSPSIKVESISSEILRLMGMKEESTISEIKETLHNFIEPPDDSFVAAEINYLHNMKMISSLKEDAGLTAYGKLVLKLNTDPASALALITGYKLNCFREVLSILCVIDIIKGTINKIFTLPGDIMENDDTKKIKWLMDKFNVAKKYFNNKYGDHLAILKIFNEYLKKRKNEASLKQWSYKYFIDRRVMENAYYQYVKLNHRYREILSKFDTTKPDRSILDVDIRYKILSSLIFGFNLNLLKNSSKGNILSIDNKINNIELEKYGFVDKKNLKSTDKLFYDRLYQYGKNPIKAKIVSLIPKKSLSIIDSLTS